MLTEVDTRLAGDREVTLWLDEDSQVYLVCLEGHAPVRCSTRSKALCVFRHPYIYAMPLEGSVSPPVTTEGVSAGDESHSLHWAAEAITDASLSSRLGASLVELVKLLEYMNSDDFSWTVNMLNENVRRIAAERFGTSFDIQPKPYDQHSEEEF